MLTVKRNDWMKMLSIMSAYTDKAKIEVADNKATTLAIDPAKVAIIKAKVDCTGECEPFSIGIEQCIKALNAAGGDDVTLDFSNAGDLVIIGNARVRMPLEADLGDINDINRSIFDEIAAEGTIDPASVESCVSYGVWNKESVVAISISDGKMKIRVGQDRHTAEVEMTGTGEASSMYPLEYFETMIKQSKGSEITVKLPNNDFPMLVEWESGTGEYSLVIAPRIEQE